MSNRPFSNANNNNDDDLISGSYTKFQNSNQNNSNSSSSSSAAVVLQGSVVVGQSNQNVATRSPAPRPLTLPSSSQQPQRSVIPPGTSEETLRTLCVRLVKDKMSLEKRISDLQNELVKESKIVTDLQTKFAALASTTVVVDRLLPPPPPPPAAPKATLETPSKKPHQQNNNINSGKKIVDDEGDDDHDHNSDNKKPITPPLTNQQNSGGVTGFFKSVIDRASALPSAIAAPKTENTLSSSAAAAPGYQPSTVAEWSKQCDDLLSLNEELHMQLFDVKHEYESKLKDAQRSNSKRETQLLAEVNSLREQLAIAQDNYVAQTRRVAEQEIVSRQAEQAMKQFRWISDRASTLEKRNGTRFGYAERVVTTATTTSLNSNISDLRLFVNNKWKAASRAFSLVLEAMIRKIENPTSVSNNQQNRTTNNSNATSKVAFQLQTLLQQWSNLEDIYSQVVADNNVDHEDDDDDVALEDNQNMSRLQNHHQQHHLLLLLPALHRTRTSMIHVIRNCATFVIPVLMKQASLCYLREHHQQHTSGKHENNYDEKLLLIASSPEIISCVTSSLQDCCDAMSCWLSQINQHEDEMKKKKKNNNRNNTIRNDDESSLLMILPSFCQLPVERFAEWMSMIAGGKTGAHKNGDSSSNDKNDDEQIYEQQPHDHFLRLIEHLAIALKNLPFAARNSTSYQIEDEDDRQKPTSKKSTTTSLSPSASKIAQQLLLQADPQQIFLSGRRQGNCRNHDEKEEEDDDDDENEAAFLSQIRAKAKMMTSKQISSKKNDDDEKPSAENEIGNDNSNNFAHLQLLLRQSLLDCDALIVQKEQLLLEKRDLAIRCDTLSDTNRALAGEMARRDFDHQDIVDTLHKQIEILSEALTESQVVGNQQNHNHHHDNYDDEDDEEFRENVDIVKNVARGKNRNHNIGRREMLMGIGEENDDSEDVEEL